MRLTLPVAAPVAERVGIDPLTEWLGPRWDSYDTYAMVDYSTGSALWQERSAGERIAVLRSEVRDEVGRLLATAIGSFSIFPRERLGGHERGPSTPEAAPAGDG